MAVPPALTFVILPGYAVAIDVLTDRHISSSFDQSAAGASQEFAGEIHPTEQGDEVVCSPAITYYGKPDGAEIRLFSRPSGQLLCSSSSKARDGIYEPANNEPAHFRVPLLARPPTYVENSFRVNTQPVSWKGADG